jgi:hypothetical protein
MVFEVGTSYTRASILAELPGADLVGAFAILGDRAMAFIELGPAADAPRFSDRSTLSWPTACPVAVTTRGMRIDVFVRGDAPDAFDYLGESMVVSFSLGGQGDARLHLHTPLPRSTWLRFYERSGGAPFGPPAETAIAAPPPGAGPGPRMAALRAFVEAWHGIALPAAPVRPAGLEMLAMLDDLMRRTPHLVVQNTVLPVEDRTPIEGRVIFYVENQGVCEWATEPTGDDPPVWYRECEPGAPWQREAEPLSGFLLQLVLFEAMMGAPYGASAACVEAEVGLALEARMAPLPLGPWLWPWPYPSRFYARSGAILHIAPLDEERTQFALWLGARHPRALDFAEDLAQPAQPGWDHVAF